MSGPAKPRKVAVCQVPDCSADLYAQEKAPYCIKRRLCREHIKADAVQRVGFGTARWRYCFQCGKLEPLENFEGCKRSCRFSLKSRRAHATGRGSTGGRSARHEAPPGQAHPAAGSPSTPGQDSFTLEEEDAAPWLMEGVWAAQSGMVEPATLPAAGAGATALLAGAGTATAASPPPALTMQACDFAALLPEVPARVDDGLQGCSSISCFRTGPEQQVPQQPQQQQPAQQLAAQPGPEGAAWLRQQLLQQRLQQQLLQDALQAAAAAPGSTEQREVPTVMPGVSSPAAAAGHAAASTSHAAHNRDQELQQHDAHYRQLLEQLLLVQTGGSRPAVQQVRNGRRHSTGGIHAHTLAQQLAASAPPAASALAAGEQLQLASQQLEQQWQARQAPQEDCLGPLAPHHAGLGRLAAPFRANAVRRTSLELPASMMHAAAATDGAASMTRALLFNSASGAAANNRGLHPGPPRAPGPGSYILSNSPVAAAAAAAVAAPPASAVAAPPSLSPSSSRQALSACASVALSLAEQQLARHAQLLMQLEQEPEVQQQLPAEQRLPTVLAQGTLSLSCLERGGVVSSCLAASEAAAEKLTREMSDKLLLLQTQFEELQLLVEYIKSVKELEGSS